MTTASDTGSAASPQARLDSRLREAVWANDVPAARRLIAEGGDVNAKDDTDQSAYLVTTSEGYLDLLDLTLANGADVGSRDSYDGTGLIRAADRGHADVVGRLIGAGIDVDHVNRLGWTALREAVILGDGGPAHQRIVATLLATSADPALGDRDGVTAREHAQSKGQGKIVKLLQPG